MKFTKGLIIGTVITAGTMMIYSEEIFNSKRKTMKMGKKLMKKISK